jgi:xanthine dehydrogenase YagR molybdenum-binding subunit
MRLVKPAGRNPVDQLRVIGKPLSRMDGDLKVTGKSTYAYEQNTAAPGAASSMSVPGAFDLTAAEEFASMSKPSKFSPPLETAIGDFDGAFGSVPVQLDFNYTTPNQVHTMMQPHATIAKWEGDQLTLWTSVQKTNWRVRDLAKTLGILLAKVRLISPYAGGGLGGKGLILSDAGLAALNARHVGRPMKVAFQRSLMFNNLTPRPATIQHIRIGATKDRTITAIGHESWSGNIASGLPSQLPEAA